MPVPKAFEIASFAAKRAAKCRGDSSNLLNGANCRRPPNDAEPGERHRIRHPPTSRAIIVFHDKEHTVGAQETSYSRQERRLIFVSHEMQRIREENAVELR